MSRTERTHDQGIEPAPRHHGQLRSIGVCAALVVLVAINFSNALRGEFAFDDKDMIQNNVLIRDVGNVKEIFTTSWWWGGARQRSDEYRPLTVLSFAVNYRLNKLDVFGYHLVNVALHAAVVLALFLFLNRLSSDRAVSGVAAAFFAAHPIHTEAVNNVVGRAELIAALFFLVGFLLYAVLRREPPKKQRLLLYAASLLCYLLGLLSKENAIMLLPMLVVYDVVLYRQGAVTPQRGALWRFLRRRVPSYAGYVAVVAFYFVLRAHALGRFMSSGMAISTLDNNLVLAKTAGDSVSYYLTAIKVIAYYAYLLCFPLRLSADYSYNQIPLSQSILEPRVLAAFVLLGVSAFYVIRSYRTRRMIPFFAISLFFLTFLPVSNLFKLIATILGERLMYLPSVGFCLLLAYAVSRIFSRLADYSPARQKPLVRSGFYILAGVIVLLYSIRTIVRNNDWRTELWLFESAAAVSPNSAKVLYNLGNNYKQRHDLASAERFYRRAYGIAPFYGSPLSGIAEIMRDTGRFEEAVKTFQQVIRMEDRYFPAHYYLGRTYFDLGRYADAFKEYERTIELRPTAPEPYYAICEVYFKLQRWSDAEEILKRVMSVTPDRAFVFGKLGVVYTQLNRPPEALAALQESIRLKPNDAETYLYLAQFYGVQKQKDAALNALNRALEIAPTNPEVHLSMARFFYSVVGDRDKALQHFRMVLQLQPTHPLREQIMRTIQEVSGTSEKD